LREKKNFLDFNKPLNENAKIIFKCERTIIKYHFKFIKFNLNKRTNKIKYKFYAYVNFKIVI
jgi:hypothetical protein